MKKVIILIMMVATGFGGYWLGQRPNSPPIFDWMSRQATQIETEGGSQWISETVAVGRDEAASVFERIRGDEANGQVADSSPPDTGRSPPVTRQPIPQCW